VEKGVDMILAIIDPSRESILLAKKISELGQQIDKPVCYILNRISDHETKDLLMNSIDGERVIAVIPENKEIFIAGLAGNEFNMDVEGIKEIADMLESKEKATIKA
jgi:CO dehydrogenase maturation factor